MNFPSFWIIDSDIEIDFTILIWSVGVKILPYE
jgi:hypothetical protein